MRFELYRHTGETKKDNQTVTQSSAISHIAILNYLREASTTLSYRYQLTERTSYRYKLTERISYRYKLAERSRSQYSHQSFRIAIKPKC